MCFGFRFDHVPTRSSQSAFGAGSSRAGSLTYNRQLHQHRLSHPPPSSLSPGRKAQQRRASPRAYEDNLEESLHRPLSPSPANAVDRFSQGRSYLSSASIQPRDYADTPIHQPQIVIPAEPSTQNLRGLTRRPRVQASRKRVSWVRANGSTRRSVDLEVPQLTEMDYSVMSVRRPNLDRSGTGLSSSFVLPPTSVRPTVIGRSETEERHLGASPSSHVSSETEPPRSRIKAQGAGPASANAYSIPGKEPHTMALPSLMNNMEEEWPSSSPVSTPKAPRLDQRSVIREDLQQQDDERPIAGRRTDPRISFGEAAAVDDRKSLDLVRSTSPLEVSHLQSHAAPANKGDDRKPPRQQALFQELYQMLEDPDSEILRSGVEVHRGGDSGEGIIRQDCVIEGSTQDTPRVPGGPEETLHMDVLLAQRVARDAMQEDGECFGWSCKLSASECGEEAVDPNSNWLECGLDRKYSTRSVFDWRYA